MKTYSKSYEDRRYDLLVSIDEEMKRLRTTANALINAEDTAKNQQTIQKCIDYCSNLQKLYSDLSTLEEEGDTDYLTEEEDENDSGFGTGMSFLGFN